MKKTGLALALILALLMSMVAGVLSANFVSANPFVGGYMGAVSIESPTNYTSYNVNAILLKFTTELQNDQGAMENRISYMLDGQANVMLLKEKGGYYNAPRFTDNPVTSTVLSNLSDGMHSVEAIAEHDVQAYGTNHTAISHSIVYFTVDTIAPNVSISSPLQNMTYYSSTVPLKFTMNEQASTMQYSLDGKANVVVSENVTLPELPYGNHTLTVFANDTAGNFGTSETVYFNVVKPPEPFPTALVTTAIVSVAVVGIGLLVCFKKRKN